MVNIDYVQLISKMSRVPFTLYTYKLVIDFLTLHSLKYTCQQFQSSCDILPHLLLLLLLDPITPLTFPFYMKAFQRRDDSFFFKFTRLKLTYFLFFLAFFQTLLVTLSTRQPYLKYVEHESTKFYKRCF